MRKAHRERHLEKMRERSRVMAAKRRASEKGKAALAAKRSDPEHMSKQREYSRRWKAKQKALRLNEPPRPRKARAKMSQDERRLRKREAAARYRKSGKKRRDNERYSASEKGRAYIQTRAARQRAERDGSRGTFTADEWRRMLRAFNWCCAYCGRRGGDLEIEHVVPLAGGGRHESENIVPACGPCNRRKRTKCLPDACLALGVSLSDVSARINLGKQAFLALVAGQPRPA